MHANGTCGTAPQPERILQIRVYSRQLAVTYQNCYCPDLDSKTDGQTVADSTAGVVGRARLRRALISTGNDKWRVTSDERELAYVRHLFLARHLLLVTVFIDQG